MSTKRKTLAKETLEILEQKQYSLDGNSYNIGQEVDYSIKNSKTISPEEGEKIVKNMVLPSNGQMADILIENLSSNMAIFKMKEIGFTNIGILNFASAKNPGGGFLNGALSQEECLAVSSGLYPTLTANPTYYEENRKCESMIYTNYAIYSPKVVFFRDGYSAPTIPAWKKFIYLQMKVTSSKRKIFIKTKKKTAENSTDLT